MKKLIQFFFSLFLFIFISGNIFNSYAQTQRNPVLEFCTGVWCQYCPDGDAIIENQIKPNIPNSIILAYHGPANSSNDPFSFFPGNSIIGLFGFSGYPTGIVDRVTGIISRSVWYSQMNTRNGIPATVAIDISRTFDRQTRQVDATVELTALEDLNGQFKYNFILVEDGVVWPQVNGGNDYVHRDIVRAMMNGALGEEVINGTWNTNQTITKTVSYTVPVPPAPGPDIVFDSCSVVVLCYKVGTPLSSAAEIQQAAKWILIPPDYVAHAAPLTPDIIGDHNTPADFDVVIRNEGLMTDKYDIGAEFTGPSEWDVQFTTVNGTFVLGETDSVEVNSGDSTIVNVSVNPNGIDGAGITKLEFVSRIYSGNHGFATLRNVTTTGVYALVVDAGDDYSAYIDSSMQDVFSENYGIVSRTALQQPGVNLSYFHLITWSQGTTLPAFHPEEVDALEAFLDLGGNLFINGQDIGSDIFEPTGQSQFAQDFYHNYLHAEYVGPNTMFPINGVPGDVIGDGLELYAGPIYDYSMDAISRYDFYADSVLYHFNGPAVAAIRADNGISRVVYLAFGFEQESNRDKRDTLFARSINWLTENVVVGNHQKGNIPYSFNLEQNYPNPFNPSTTIKYSLPSESFTTLKVFDVLGNEVAALVNSQKQAGTYEVEFNASNLSSGIYFYKLQSSGSVLVKKMMVLK